MGSFKPSLDDFGSHGELRVSFPLWVVFALLTRHIWFTAAVIASAGKVRESAALLADFSWWPLLIELPALAVAGIVFLRKPEAGSLARLLWRWGRAILATVAAAQLVYIAWRWSEADRSSVFWSFVDAGLATAVVVSVAWLFFSPYARAVFADFPAPRPSDAEAAPRAGPPPVPAAARPAPHAGSDEVPVAGRTAGTPDRRPAAEGASSAVDRPLASRSDESAAKLQRVVALFGQKEFGQAEQLCRELLDENRNDPDALHLMGVMRHYLGDDKAAEVLISRAITLVPDFVAYYVNLAAIYRAIGREQDAAGLEERIAAIEKDKGQPQPVLR